MSTDFYHSSLISLLAVCGGLLASTGSKNTKTAGRSTPVIKSASQWSFYTVYALVMGADWIQGPFLDALYRQTYGLSTGTIAQLFTAGFVSGAVASSATGSLADRYGRRAACLAFCLIYGASALLTASGRTLALLTAGRVLGGVATSLLFSVFESWMVADFNGRDLQAKGLDLQVTFARMATINSIMAIVAGIVSEWLVVRYASNGAPFLASIVLLVAAAGLITTQWDENYGTDSPANLSANQTERTDKAKPATTATPATVAQILAHRNTQAIAVASTLFEGAMYLFVFFWGPALSHAAAQPTRPLPYGIIFASFMAASTAASLLLARSAVGSSSTANPQRAQYALLAGVLGGSSVLFGLVAASTARESRMFVLFCAYEAMVGLYWPCIAALKSAAVADEVRARVYSLLRIPVNVFVVLAMWFASTVTGDAAPVFLVGGVGLAGAVGAVVILVRV
ncbi:hypothetical protein TD95_000937, partial [Thielaviopsis punctulata]